MVPDLDPVDLELFRIRFPLNLEKKPNDLYGQIRDGFATMAETTAFKTLNACSHVLKIQITNIRPTKHLKKSILFS
jgi:hypothetical protein